MPVIRSLNVLNMKILSLLIIFLIAGCGDMCGSELIQESESPNGKLKAVSFLYNCGATTDFSTQVSILDLDEAIDSSGNVFTSKGKNNIRITWISNNELIIENTKSLNTYKKEKEFDSVSVTYK